MNAEIAQDVIVSKISSLPGEAWVMTVSSSNGGRRTQLV